ncbi:outer membrane transport energization protein TonB [Tibeticola sediminis]|uniref:Outer membrane transport energization protein TonB n=2 Tax=Tibeticola sediminis TaxID=1917811 RepID=A0A3N4UCI5_9BURK|nr:outer membrane transport energization protein TonB [Tibeticola sediminis]
MTPDFRPRDPARRIKGIAIVIAVHVLIGYVLISGMARQGLNLIKKPLEAVVIQEVIIPPPPPPPPPPKVVQKPEPQAPKVDAPPPFVPPPDVPTPVSNAPAIVATTTPPSAPAPIAPPPPPAPAPAPPAPPKPRDIGVICPTQVPPEMPRKALQEGIGGVVRAQARIQNGVVKEVTILSGPRIFHNAVREAMLQYKCASEAQEVIAVQEFNFKVE